MPSRLGLCKAESAERPGRLPSCRPTDFLRGTDGSHWGASNCTGAPWGRLPHQHPSPGRTVQDRRPAPQGDGRVPPPPPSLTGTVPVRDAGPRPADSNAAGPRCPRPLRSRRAGSSAGSGRRGRRDRLRRRRARPEHAHPLRVHPRPAPLAGPWARAAPPSRAAGADRAAGLAAGGRAWRAWRAVGALARCGGGGRGAGGPGARGRPHEQPALQRGDCASPAARGKVSAPRSWPGSALQALQRCSHRPALRAEQGTCGCCHCHQSAPARARKNAPIRLYQRTHPGLPAQRGALTVRYPLGSGVARGTFTKTVAAPFRPVRLVGGYWSSTSSNRAVVM